MTAQNTGAISVTDTVDPTAAADSHGGFGVGSRWTNTTTGVTWISLVSTPTAAVWEPISHGFIRKATGVAAVIPSATANTYGTGVVILPPTFMPAFLPQRINLTGAGTFGAETLSVRATMTHSDGSTMNVIKTFTSTTAVEFTLNDFYNLLRDAVRPVKLTLDAQSTIANSTASGSYFIALSGI